jgi:serine/threonine protein kinase
MSFKLFGRYELCQKVATGGMAEVFLAVQRGRSGFVREVIIKRLFRHLADDARVLRLFKNEAQLLAALDHPGLPQVYEFGAAEGQWYIAMEHVRGHSVAQLVDAAHQSGIPIPFPVACSVVIQAADALGYAHDYRHERSGLADVVHRDVTPQNLMVGKTGHIKVLDFGVAQTAEGTGTNSGVVTGTYAYMPPEQVHGRKLDRRVDVFALGVILYELTTQSRLFPGTDLEVMTAVVEQEPPLPSSRREQYPSDLEAVVLRALAKERIKRTATAADLEKELETIAARHGWLIGSHTLRDYLRSVGAWLPPQAEVAFDDPALGLATAGRSSGTPAADALVEHFDDDSLLEDIRMLSEPLGSSAPPPARSTLEFAPDALSADLGEARSTRAGPSTTPSPSREKTPK